MATVKRAEHRNAIAKLVREQRIIMQKELARRMNKTDVKTTITEMVKEGKFRRDKIKVRSAAGGLFDQYVVYANDVRYEEILNLERKMIDKPFESPLKENHCYKKINPDRIVRKGQIGRPRKDREMVVVERENTNNTNVVDIQKYIRVNSVDVGIKIFKGDRVVTAHEIARLHNREVKRVNEQLENNMTRFKNGIDYHLLTRLEAKVDYTDFEKYFTSPRQKEIYLYTEKGYLKLTKTFTDDLSWEVQDMLVDNYFRMKELSQKVENNLPVVKQDFSQMQFLELMFLQMKNQDQRLSDMEEFVRGIKQLAQ